MAFERTPEPPLDPPLAIIQGITLSTKCIFQHSDTDGLMRASVSYFSLSIYHVSICNRPPDN